MLELMEPAGRQHNDALESGHAMAGGTAAITNIGDESLQPIVAGGARRTQTKRPFESFLNYQKWAALNSNFE